MSFFSIPSPTAANAWNIVYLPKLTDEIQYVEGKEAIRQYYRNMADDKADDLEEQIQNEYNNGNEYSYTGTTYGVSYVEDYLSVKYLSLWHGGGRPNLFKSCIEKYADWDYNPMYDVNIVTFYL